MSNDTREALAALMVIAAECAQRKPLRGFEELTEATHIGHRQFGRAHEQADEDVRMLAVRLRAVFDTLAAALATQPAQPSAQGEAVAHPSHLTVREWMPVNEALRLADVWSAGDLDNCGQWRAAIKVLADEVRALASAPAAPAQAVPLTQRDVDEEDASWVLPNDLEDQ